MSSSGTGIGGRYSDAPAEAFMFEADVKAMVVCLVIQLGNLQEVLKDYQNPNGKYNKLIQAVSLAQKLNVDNPFAADMLAKLFCVVMTVKERILRMEDLGGELAVVPTPNSRWYTKPVVKDPIMLEPMQAKVAKFLEQQCGRGASPQCRLATLKKIVEMVDTAAESMEVLMDATPLLRAGHAILTDFDLEASIAEFGVNEMTSHQGLCKAVAQMCGGDHCLPSSQCSQVERTAVEALKTSAFESSMLPLGDTTKHLQLTLGPSQLALPSTQLAVPVPTSECIVVDSDEERCVDIVACMDPFQDPLLQAYVVFKVVHTRPGRLKRPLHSDDAIGSNDVALRKYTILERDVSVDANLLRVRVTCEHGSEVLCSDLFGSADPDTLMRTMVQLRVDSSGPSASVVECSLDSLKPLIDAGAFPGGNNKFHDLGDDNTIESMQLLELDGLVTSTGLGEGQWCLTAAAVEGYIRQSFWLSSPTKLFAPRTDLPLDQCTQVELQILLANNGWEQLSLVEHQDKAHVPFKGGTDSCKNWFSDRNGRFFSAYLVCLLKSEKLFQAGLKGGIFHGQIESYYSALLASLDQGLSLEQIQPWKPAKFYRGIIKGQEPEGEGDANAAPKLRLMDDIDDVPALEAGSGLSGPAAAAISHADAPSTRQDAVEVLRPPDRHVPSSSSAAPSAVRSQPKQRSEPKARSENSSRRQGTTRSSTHEKSHHFGDFFLAYYESGAVPSWRAVCSVHEQCTKSMRTNQERNEDDVCRRLKAWCLKAFDPDCDSKHHHVFFSAVPTAAEAGSNDDLKKQLERLSKSKPPSRK
ncbi:unnamed protein product [Cladocopium goreaui]|uniref:Uncharacterized protein n=1 Tax=Cladocopium goreaui TaxID=2562237 RepID=A0A9P1DLL7_9DINO|nr:unnamed protein product [Cladocopium goreaui]